MDEPRPDREARDSHDAGAVPALVEAQLENARSAVFRAYVRARDQARELADAERADPADRADRHRRAP